MKKLSLKLNNDQLDVLIQLFDFNSIENIDEGYSSKALVNIARLLLKKLRKKAIDKEFDTKPFKIMFHYYEAYTLYRIMLWRLYIFRDAPYEYNLINKLSNELDKQLV